MNTQDQRQVPQPVHPLEINPAALLSDKEQVVVTTVTPPQSPTASRKEPHTRRRVLVCWDNSSDCNSMVEWAIANVLTDSDHVVLATVMDVQESTYMHVNFGQEASVGRQGYGRRLSVEEREEAVELLKPVVDRLNSKGVTAQIHVLKGDAREKLLQLSRDIRADIVIVGSRGLGTFKRLLGSVSDYLVRNCTCPVIVTKVKQLTPSPAQGRRKSLLETLF
ncbi:uncharacterized protein VTP21DRAFT_5529 [Calcarisporiella thermophila]|uniref:uncharacterized protein n=1 Tax=Calcarisporiella thermophila TaxID=911321 RepID=UPI00374310EF